MIAVDVVLGALILLLGLANLGTMREVVFLRSELASFSQLLTTPPEPAWLATGHPPKTLADAHARLTTNETDQLILVYVESSCPTCRTLVSDLHKFSTYSQLARTVTFVLVDKQAPQATAPPLLLQIEQTSCRVLLDSDNELLSAAGIYGTPSALALTGTRALDYKAGVNAKWILDRLGISGT